MQSIVFALLASALLLAGCGSPYDERQKARETERQRKVVAYQEALAGFAKRHSADPVDLFRGGFTAEAFTAQLQDQLEGRTIAFRSELRDIVRISESEYRIFLGNVRFGGNVAMLSADKAIAEGILNRPSPGHSEYLVVAHVEHVTPLLLEVNSCSEQDCSEIELRTDLRYPARRISGRAIVVEGAD